MGEPIRRKFTVADAMILIAATAIGLAWVHANQAAYENYRAVVSPLLFVRELVQTKFED
jgi:hypothetical protein